MHAAEARANQFSQELVAERRLAEQRSLDAGEEIARLRELAEQSRGALQTREVETLTGQESIERLEDALTGYEGALLLITHDDALADTATTTTWTIGEDGIQ